MKKILLQSLVLSCTSVPVMAQLDVSTTPGNKIVILEEYTGIYCVNCPDGHKVANTYKASKPKGSVILVNIHTSSFADATPDYRTADGDAIARIPGTGITGYPQGSINRHDFGSGSTAMSRSKWASSANTILSQASPVNVAVRANINPATRELEVEVKAYYTAAETVENKLTVMLIEDSLYSDQVGDTYYPEMVTPAGYTHLHMLRDVITPAATGELISPTTKGTTITKKYTATIPADYKGVKANIKNMSVVAFVAQGNKEILSGAEAHVTHNGGLAAPEYTSPIPVLNLYPNPVASSNLSAAFSVNDDVVLGWKVIDMTGKEISKALPQKYPSGYHTIHINTDQMANGIYQLVLTTADGLSRTDRFSVLK